MAEEEQRMPTDHLYWARSASAGAAPPPKPISAEEAKRLEASSSTGGSAWNKSGNTWEEKKINQWSFDLLKAMLPEQAFELPGAGNLPRVPEDYGGLAVKLRARVLSVESVSGECTYVLSRGKQRVVFELQIKCSLEMELRAGDELKHILTGKLTLPELSNDDLDEAKLPGGSKCTCDQGGEWRAFFEASAKAGMWPTVKGSLEALIEQAKQKWAA